MICFVLAVPVTSGVVGDMHDSWIFDYASKLGRHDGFLAGEVAIKQELQLCWQRGYRKVQCESDCSSVIDMPHKRG